jgi:hypothetical protein
VTPIQWSLQTNAKPASGRIRRLSPFRKKSAALYLDEVCPNGLSCYRELLGRRFRAVLTEPASFPKGAGWSRITGTLSLPVPLTQEVLMVLMMAEHCGLARLKEVDGMKIGSDTARVLTILASGMDEVEANKEGGHAQPSLVHLLGEAKADRIESLGLVHQGSKVMSLMAHYRSGGGEVFSPNGEGPMNAEPPGPADRPLTELMEHLSLQDRERFHTSALRLPDTPAPIEKLDVDF